MRLLGVVNSDALAQLVFWSIAEQPHINYVDLQIIHLILSEGGVISLLNWTW